MPLGGRKPSADYWEIKKKGRTSTKTLLGKGREYLKTTNTFFKEEVLKSFYPTGWDFIEKK